MRLICVSAVLVPAAAVGVAAQSLVGAGSIVGCVSDSQRQVLPGATVMAKGGGVQRTTLTGDDGCYQLSDLPAASYRVTARLTGFDNVTRDRLAVGASSAIRVDVTMRISSICECVRIAGTLAEQRAGADAVLYLRLAADEQTASTPQGYYRHRATVLTVVKPPPGARPSSVFVLQNQRSGSPPPYEAGQELVAFLKSSDAGQFFVVNDEPGVAIAGSGDPSIVFLVLDGRVQRAPGEFAALVGTPIGSFLEMLRGLSGVNPSQ